MKKTLRGHENNDFNEMYLIKRTSLYFFTYM